MALAVWLAVALLVHGNAATAIAAGAQVLDDDLDVARPPRGPRPDTALDASEKLASVGRTPRRAPCRWRRAAPETVMVKVLGASCDGRQPGPPGLDDIEGSHD